ncbi:BlaI/MecI/CopY family transcriptional regulator [Sciscionella marina]|uniref:BlaI/MecI/CopY family transcriptional regulator n=1 Tax=Sciscionella marina TaxID=508770 RepID=UPI0003766BDE|nr:BlaI/MecI/CopY family transcriptional regulator [Sciscionella marina]
MGDLEAAVLQQLWNEPQPVTGRELLERLARPSLGYTTLMTVLKRLVDKQLVERVSEGRSIRYRAAGDLDELTAQAIEGLLSSAQDRQAVLAHLIESVDDPALVAELRAVLDRTDRP